MPIDFDAMDRDGLFGEQPSLSETIKSVPDYSPDEHAKDIELGDKLGMPPDLVKPNRDSARLDAQFVDTPESRIRATAPALADRLRADPDFAILSKDDLEALRELSEGVGYFDNLQRGLRERGGELLGNFVDSLGRTGRYIGEGLHTMTMDNEERARFAEQKAQRAPRERDTVQDRIADALRNIDLGYQAPEGWDKGKEAFANGDYAAGIGHMLSWGFTTGIVSLPDMLAAINPTTLPAYMMARGEEVARERAANNKRDTPNDEDTAIGYLAAPALALMEKMGFGAKAFKGAEGIVKGAAKGAVKEGAAEFPQESAEYLATFLGTEQGATLAGFIESGLQGMVAGGALGGSLGVATGAVADVQSVARGKAKAKLEEGVKAAEKADNTAESLKALGQQVQKTKLFGRSRRMLGELIDASSQSKEVTIDLEGLNELGQQMSAKDFSNLVTALGIKDQGDIANMTGEATVTLGTFLKNADNPAFDALVAHTKADPFGVTPAQAAKQAKDLDAEVKRLTDEILKREGPQSKRLADAERAHTQLVSDLTKAGWSEKDATLKADVARNMALRLSELTGLDVATAFGELRARRKEGSPLVRTVTAEEAAVRAPAAPAAERRAEAVPVEAERRVGERRVDAERRAKVEAMTPEQQVKALYTNELTGLNNRRAFEEDVGAFPYVASIDADSLKTVNDMISPRAGDELLRAIAEVLDQVLPDQAYHISGDEFYVLGNDPELIKAGLAEAQALLAERSVSDTKGTLQGLSFSYGLDSTKEAADLAMKQNKRDREASGQRAARGEAPAGLQLTTTLGQSASIRRGLETLESLGLDPNKSYLTREVAIALAVRQALKYGKIDLNDRSDEASAKMAEWMVEEIIFEMENPGASGLGWYSQKWGQTIDLFANQYPELATDQNARDMFTMLMAVASDGQKVMSNFTFASALYADMKKHGKLLDAEIESNRAIAGHARKINDLMARFGGDVQKVKEYLLEVKTVEELRAIAREEGVKFDVQYLGDVELPRAAGIFGPKLGAFYANLAGSYGYLTMDRWWSRTFNRYRGDTVTRTTESSIKNLRELLIENGVAADLVESQTDVEIASITYARLYGKNNFVGEELTPLEQKVGSRRPTGAKAKAAWDKEARALVGREWKALDKEDKFLKSNWVTPLEALIKTKQPTTKAGKVAWTKKAQAAAGADFDAMFSEHRLWKASNTVNKAAHIELRDVPENPSDRSFMINTVRRARKLLKKKTGTDMSVADIQAVLWYYEKRLYGELGARQSADISYVEAAQQWLSDKDVPIIDTIRGPDGQIFELGEDRGLNIEVAPDPNNQAATAAFATLSQQNKLDATMEAAYAIIPKVAQAMGFPTVSVEFTNGGYLDHVNPSMVIRSPELSSQDLVDLGRVLGDVFSQDSIAVFDETNVDPETAVMHVSMRPDRPLNEAEIEALYYHLRENARGVGGFTYRGGAFVVGDYEGVGADFGPAISAALADLDIDVEFEVVEKAFSATLEEINHGESERKGIEKGGDVLRRKGGDPKILRSLRKEAGSILGSHLQTTYGQPVQPASLDSSLHPGGLKVNARGMVPLTHWSRVEGLATLDPAQAGTGMDRLRRRSDPNAPTHVFFGAPGYQIEGGVAAGAQARYYAEVDPKTLYDVSRDPDGLYDAVKAANPGAYPYQIDAMYMQAIRDAGYQGHWFDQGNNGAVVAMYGPVDVQQAKSVQTLHRSKRGWVAGFDIDGNAFTESYNQLRRGQITMGPDRSMIDLFEGADMSTFMHEAAHHFLHRLMLFSEKSSQAKQEMDKILKWMGLDHPSQITEEYHEMFARGFESYLSEGKAPKPELRTVFQIFRDWIVSTYESLKELDVTLNDDVREVFERMVGADFTYETLNDELAADPLFVDDPAGFTEAEHGAYVRAVADAREISKGKLDKEVLEDEMRTKSSEFTARVNKLAEEFMEMLGANRAFKTVRFLRTGKGLDFEPFKLNADEIKAKNPDLFDALPKGKKAIYSGDGVPLRQAAEMLGFDGVDQMLDELVAAGDLRTEAMTRAKLKAKEELGYTAKDEASLRQAATDAILSRNKADTLYMELRALDRLSGGKGLPRNVLKEVADRKVQEMKVTDLKPGKYLAATIRYAREAATATRAKDYAKAARAKRAQLLNHLMYNRVRDARSNADGARRYFRKFYKKAAGKRIKFEYLEQIHNILEAYELRRTTAKERQDRKDLADFVAEQIKKGEAVLVPASAVAQASRTPIETMTVGKLREVQDWVKNLEHLGSLHNKLHGALKAIEFEALKKDTIASLLSNNKVSDVLPIYRQDLMSLLRQKTDSFLSGLANMEFVMKRLDGDKRGILYNTIWKPISDAQDRLAVRKMEAGDAIKELNDRYGMTPRYLGEDVYIPELDVTLPRSTVLSIALNWGNEGGRNRLTSANHSPKTKTTWTEQDYQTILSKLGKNDWNWVQGVWDHLDSYWPEISQLEKEMTGVPPEKVEALSVETAFGTFRGGYYPLVYDTRVSTEAAKHDEALSVQEMFGRMSSRAQTRHGHTEARLKELGRTVKLDLGVIDQHISTVLLDLTHREPVSNVAKLIGDRDVAEALKATAGVEVYNQLNPWLKHVAGSYRNNPLDALSATMRHLRIGSSVVGIGFSLTTALVNITGLFPALIEIRNPLRLMGGVLRTSKNPIDTWKFITERSEMMQLRSKVFNREASEQLRTAHQKELIPMSLWYSLIAKVDQMVTMSTWMAAYEQQMAKNGNNEADAVDYADHVVRTTQSSSRVADLSDFQRSDNELKKLVTVFYSYFNMVFNQTGNIKRKMQRGEIISAIGDIVALMILPVVVGNLLTGKWNDEDDDESYLAFTAKGAAAYMINTIPIARDIVTPMLTGFKYQITPVQGFGENLYDLSRQFENFIDPDEEVDPDKARRAAVRSLGYVLHLPAGQIDKILKYVMSDDKPDVPAPGHIWYSLMGAPKE